MYLPVTNLSAAHALLEQKHLSRKKKKIIMDVLHTATEYKYTEYKFALVRSTSFYHLKPHFHTTPALLKKVLPSIYKHSSQPRLATACTLVYHESNLRKACTNKFKSTRNYCVKNYNTHPGRAWAHTYGLRDFK